MKSKHIPRSTQAELDHPAPRGRRHSQLLKIVISLTANGWSPQEIFRKVRPNYDASGPYAVPDAEIWGIIDGAKDYDLEPASRSKAGTEQTGARSARRNKEDIAAIVERVRDFVGDTDFLAEDFRARSRPRRLKSFRVADSDLFIDSLFCLDDRVNIVSRFTDLGSGKASPSGQGETRTAAAWIRHIIDNAPPEDDAGAWIRINPVDGCGIADRNITDFRYALLESDTLPLELQLSLFAKVALPIVAIVSSGGKSVHAWVAIAARDAEEYREQVRQLFAILAPFGIDLANKNPSRLARLPGVRRRIGAVGKGLQELIFLNRDAEPTQVIADLKPTEASDVR